MGEAFVSESADDHRQALFPTLGLELVSRIIESRIE